MSPSSWKRSLRTILANPGDRTAPPRVALLGIGNALDGDDAAGLLVARGLTRRLASPGPDGPLVLEAGLAPESFTGPVRRFRPEVVLLVDAAEMGLRPGSIRVLDAARAEGFGPSTHLQGLATLAQYLSAEAGCRVWLAGIQPGRLGLERPPSGPVRRAVDRLAEALAGLLRTAPG